MKLRFLEPGELQYRHSVENYYTYEKYIRNPSIGLMTLATIAKKYVQDTVMYSESVSKIKWKDVLDADIVFISIFTFNANRGYELAQYVKKNSNAVVVLGGLHASMNYSEAVQYCDYVLLGEGDESIVDLITSYEEGKPLSFEGLAYLKEGEVVCTGNRKPPENIDYIPDRNIVYNYKKMAGHNTLWPQVHASRGCPYSCDYCALVRHFGRRVRTRSPENVVEDIRQAITFHDEGHHRMAKVLWITDDNFFADRKWAMDVLQHIIDNGIKYRFTVQARYEVGFDDEMLELLKKAGFMEISMGIEFLEDASFEEFHKECSYQKLVQSIENIQAHGLNVRGLFIVGADIHEKGVGEKIAHFVLEHNIKGILIQSMYFVPGTPVYEQSKDKLLHQNWSKYNGNVVHYPKRISAYDLQKEIIYASKKIYSLKRMLYVITHWRGIERLLFIGEYFWQRSVRARLKKELVNLPREINRE